MSAEQLLLALPSQGASACQELTIHQWYSVLEQFAAQGGREVLLGGAEPLACPKFWPLVRRSMKLGVPRVTAYISGSLLEPWVIRELVESGVHLLVALDSLTPEHHDALHGSGSHSRAMAALELFLREGLAKRAGILATITRGNQQDLPMLGAWAAGRGFARFLWTTVPDGGWPSPQLEALRLSPSEKTHLLEAMRGVARSLSESLYVGPVDGLEETAEDPRFSRLLRVEPWGGASWGFSGQGGRLGDLKRSTIQDLVARGFEAAGD